MVSIHTTLAVHAGPPGSGSVPAEYLETVKRGLAILARDMRLDARCNASFSRLHARRSFKTLFDDARIWINYDPVNNGADWGWTSPRLFPHDLVITRFALRMGRWSTAATIVHELAHLNGAPGHRSKAAELRVMQCHMQSKSGPYDPTVEG
jgi:hypothetical protein